MKVSEIFNLGLSQAFLDFVDIDLNTDLEVFVDPTALRALESPWGAECASLVQKYFGAVLDHIKHGRHNDAKKLLSRLKERNEFHIGYSKGKSRGSAFGDQSATLVWDALCNSRAATSGLLQDLEDTCLLIHGIGKDMISDAVCNIIRKPLIEYTQDMCRFYGIPLTPNVSSGPIWNHTTNQWENEFTSLPMANGHTFVLIPKNIVRRKIAYDFNDYYSHYILEELRHEHINAGTALVHYLQKTGEPRVYKKDLREQYGNNKESAIEQTFTREHVWRKYKSDKDQEARPPINNENFAQLQSQPQIDWEELINELKAIEPGTAHADKYEKTIEKILTALFFPNLNYPKKQAVIHDGRKRIDIRYNNESKSGFFHWVGLHQPAMFIQVECKNYSADIANPELDQLSGRFSPSRGKIGLLVCRSIDNKPLLDKRCKDTAHDQRGFIIVLTDEDIERLINDYIKSSPMNNGIERNSYPLLRQKFDQLVN